jgi:CRISPR-associated protein Cas1
MPQSMLLNLESHHIQQELFRNKFNASEPLKKQLWQQTIKTKIENQSELLKRLGKYKAPLNYYASKVLSGDTDNREGVAAAYYWKHLFDFKRQRYGDYPNLFLNYGYIILRVAVARSRSGSGLLNTLGIHHHNKYNAFCLADDIMEPYRPIVDAKVIEILQKYNEQDLITPIKAELLGVLTSTVYF